MAAPDAGAARARWGPDPTGGSSGVASPRCNIETSRPADATPTRRACLCRLPRVRCDLYHMEVGVERGALGDTLERLHPQATLLTPGTLRSTTRPTSNRRFRSRPASALPCPAGRSGPWSRRTGAREASATRRFGLELVLVLGLGLALVGLGDGGGWEAHAELGLDLLL